MFECLEPLKRRDIVLKIRRRKCAIGALSGADDLKCRRADNRATGGVKRRYWRGVQSAVLEKDLVA